MRKKQPATSSLRSQGIPEFSRFVSFAKRLLAVPKKELPKLPKNHKRGRPKKSEG